MKPIMVLLVDQLLAAGAAPGRRPESDPPRAPV